MLPSEEQVRTTAYYLWELRQREHGYDLADWLTAERNLLLSMNYEVIARYYLDGPQKVYFGDKSKRRCRYCGKGKPEVTFRTDAHALPQAIGNKSLIGNDECDGCNKFFSETLEDSFGKFLLPLRSMLGIRGQGGVPTYCAKDKGARIEFDPIGNGLRVLGPAAHVLMRDDAENKRLISDLECQPYVPVRVLKCLVKMAIAIMPEEELPNFVPTISWLSCADDRTWLNRICGAGCYFYFIPRFEHRPCTMLMRRNTTDTPLPYMLFTVGVRGALLQISVPLTHMDNIFSGKKVIIPMIGSMMLPGLGESHCESIRLDSADVVNSTMLSVQQRYHSRQENPSAQKGTF